ncbi:hypothetical protein HB364_24575 [Pseudoflavitalea sp. X16]|uniref:hypothetical protein n=1 Tax=Paraflavitalea devenefica TaxID=2716334 RepID=UPI0014225017|nr:hypothetical protein [Paraflavitalea devenefica]NII28282.1 hypothetical protein [Paraflavitalea devenefica]
MTRIVSVVLLLLSINTLAQDTLPKFTAYIRGSDKVIISWTNAYPKVTQISIQRSTDSLKLFKTILTVPDPTVPQNGYLDAKGASAAMFYRLFIVLDSGKYVFTRSQRPFRDTAVKTDAQRPDIMPENNARQRVVIPENMAPGEAELLKEKIQEAMKKADPKALMPAEKVEKVEKTKPAPTPEPERFFVIKRRDTVIMQVSEKAFKKFRDSIVLKTKDTMTFRALDTIVIKPFVPKEVYRPSKYVFTESGGNVVIILPDVKSNNYGVKFYEEDKTFLFEVKHVKESYLVVDKTNFLHAGWFRFELYEDGKIKEQHKFFIPKD